MDSSGILGLREDLQKLIIGEEEEPGKGHTFRFKVVTKTLLDLVKQLVALSEVLKESVV